MKQTTDAKMVSHRNNRIQEESINVIFKGLNKCNAGCVFCCIGDAGGEVISWEGFEKVISEIEKLVQERNLKHITFTYHGGEPTLLKAELLDRMCDRVKQVPAAITFNMQSNLISLPSSLRRILSKHHIKIGTSIDPLGVDRVLQNGKSAFHAWLKTFVKYAMESEPPGAIYVITRHSLGKEEHIYNMCETIGALIGQRFALQLNPVYSQGKASAQEDDLSITPAEYSDFMINFWRLWELNRRSLSISPIQSFANYFLPGRRREVPHLACSYNGKCPGSHLGVDYNLNVAGCGRRLDSGAFIGNLNSSSLSQIIRHNTEREQLCGRIAMLKDGECGDCTYFEICHGGCPDDAWLESGDVRGKTHWCEAHKSMFSTMEREIASRRKPASIPPPAPGLQGDTIDLVLAGKCTDVPRSVSHRSEIWMLPGAQENWMKFDSGLSDVLKAHRSHRIRLWCTNKKVPALMMWEDTLRSPLISAVLFEPEGLSDAMNALNSLRVPIELDVRSIIDGPEGEKTLATSLERYLSDPLWRVQVYPFSKMIETYLHRRPITLLDEFGLPVGGYRVSNRYESEIGECHFLPSLPERLFECADADRVSWVLDRLPCLDCEYYRFCGMRFASGNQRPCDAGIKRLVGLAFDTANQMVAHVQGFNN